MFADEKDYVDGSQSLIQDSCANTVCASTAPARGPRVRQSIRRFGQDKSGSSLIEFSLIAFVLLFVIFATVEIGFVYWATEQLENGNSEAARLVRTGQAQQQALNQAQLKDQICLRARILPDCAARLRLDLQSADTFGEINPPDPLDGNGDLKSDGEFAFAPGGPSSISLLTAFYSWPIGFFGGPYLLRASIPMRNEPFEQ